MSPALSRWVVPLTVAILIALFRLQRRGTRGIGNLFGRLMATWLAGRRRIAAKLAEVAFPFEAFAADVATNPPPRVRGTGVFLSANPAGVPPVLFHHYKHNQVLHDQVVLLSIVSEAVPHVPPARRVEVQAFAAGIFRVVARIGFMEAPDVPAFLTACAPQGLEIELPRTSYHFGHETLAIRDRRGMRRAWKRLFAVLLRNAQGAPAYFRIPPNRVVEMGMQLEL